MSELPATLTQLQQMIASGDLSAKVAVKLQHQRLKTLDTGFHAAIHIMADEGNADPMCAGPLAGIGLAHKDIFNLAGFRPGVGHDTGSSLPELPPAVAITRLEAAGATTLATLAMAEYACGATGDNPRFERCVNPLNACAMVGGSSSGSAVAVAAGMVYGSLGTDTLGSVRIPAATCGLLGLKTTHGLIPLDGVYPLASSLDSIGIITRTSADARQLLDIVADRGLLRPASARPWRVKAWLPATGLHGDVAAALESFMRKCEASQWPSTWPEHQRLSRLAEIVMHTEAACTHRQSLLACTAPTAVENIALAGLAMPPAWCDAALADRGCQAQEFVSEHLQAHDLLLLPALPQPIPDWDQVVPGSPGFDVRQLLALHAYMGFVNYLGFPSLVFPVAQDARGLPISVQVIAKPFHEIDLLAFAEKNEMHSAASKAFTQQFLHQD